MKGSVLNLNLCDEHERSDFLKGQTRIELPFQLQSATRGVMIPGLESIPEPDFEPFSENCDSDSDSSSNSYWNRFQSGIDSKGGIDSSAGIGSRVGIDSNQRMGSAK